VNQWILGVLIFFISLAAASELQAQLKPKPSEEPSLLPAAYSLVNPYRTLPPKDIEMFFSKMGEVQYAPQQLSSVPIQVYQSSTLHLPDIYQYEDLAFFCKWEVKLEKAAQMPVKFRLGDVQYVDWLEGKRPDY
jgi:hypothetical protein